jgi:hypothetical protein
VSREAQRRIIMKLDANKIKAALNEVHVLESQYGTSKAYQMVVGEGKWSGLGSHKLNDGEKQVLRGVLRLS